MANTMKEVLGSAEIVAGAVIDYFTAGTGGNQLIVAGATTLIGGILEARPLTGTVSAEKNPVAPWTIAYGRVAVGGIQLYDFEWGGGSGNNNVRDIVFCLAANQCAMDINHPPELLFDQQRVQIDTSTNAIPWESPWPAPNGWSGTSFTPKWQDDVTITAMSRLNGVVTVTVSADIPYLTAGDKIFIQGVNHGISGSDQTFNGVFPVAQITNAVSTHYQGPIGLGTELQFTYLSGGISSTPNIVAGPASVSTEWPAGSNPTGHTWADYTNTVYVEYLPGVQCLGQTFIGQLAGTPYEPGGAGSFPWSFLGGSITGIPIPPPTVGNNGGLGAPNSPHNYGGDPVPNPWVANCSAQGKTLAFVRVLFQKAYYQSGLPHVTFRFYGKNDIYDPRLGAYGTAGTTGYTENAALCIADFIHTGSPLSAPYNPSTTYAAGNVASFQSANQTTGIDYVSIISSNTGNQPDTHTSDWTPVTSANLPTNWGAGNTYAAGALVSRQQVLGTFTTQYVSLSGSNTGNDPASSPSYWAALSIPVFALPDWGYRLPYATGPTLQSPQYIDAGVQTTIASNISTGSQTVTPASMTGISVGMSVLVSNSDTTNNEYVTVTATTGSTFTASFTSTKTGPGIKVSTGLCAAANICDYPVTLNAGGTEPMYALNGTFSLDKKRADILEEMLTACAGRISIVGGAWSIHPGYWSGTGAPTVNLTGSICAGPVEWRYQTIRDIYNGIRGTFISPYNNWQPTDFPYYAQDSFHGYSGPAQYGGDINIQADGGDRRWMQIHLPFTISASAAQRIAKIYLLRNRWASLPPCSANGFPGGGSGTFKLNMSGYQYVPLDVLAAEVPFLWSSTKLLECGVTRLTLSLSDGSVLLGTEIEAQATDSSIYAWSTAEELTPQGYVQTTFPTGTLAEQFPLPWSPGNDAPLTGDAIGGPATFGIAPVYTIDAAGNAIALVPITGYLPINATDDEMISPLFGCAPATTGGSIPPGIYVVGLTARSAGGTGYSDTPYHTLGIVTVGGTGSGSIVITPVWDPGNDGGDLYMGLWEPGQAYTLHWQQTLASGASTATITSFNQSTSGGPDPDCDHLSVVWQKVEHSGVWDGQIPSTASITTSTVTITSPTTTSNQYAGYVLTLLGRTANGVDVPVINLPIASNTASSSGLTTFTIGAGVGGTLPDLTTLLQAGDLLIMRGNYTYTNGGQTFSDLNTANSYYPTGAAPTAEPGRVAVMITGLCAGQVQTIVSVTQDINSNYTVFNLASPFQSYSFSTGTYSPPANGDLLIICDATTTEVPLAPFSCINGQSAVVVGQPSIPNDANQTWRFLVRTEDANGLYGSDVYAPSRDVYLFGALGTTNI